LHYTCKQIFNISKTLESANTVKVHVRIDENKKYCMNVSINVWMAKKTRQELGYNTTLFIGLLTRGPGTFASPHSFPFQFGQSIHRALV